MLQFILLALNNNDPLWWKSFSFTTTALCFLYVHLKQICRWWSLPRQLSVNSHTKKNDSINRMKGKKIARRIRRRKYNTDIIKSRPSTNLRPLMAVHLSSNDKAMIFHLFFTHSLSFTCRWVFAYERFFPLLSYIIGIIHVWMCPSLS